MAYIVTVKSGRFYFDGGEPKYIEATKSFKYESSSGAMALIRMMIDGSIDEIDFAVKRVEEEEEEEDRWQTD